MDLKKIGYESVNWSLLAHGMVQCKALVNIVMKSHMSLTWDAQILGTRSAWQINVVCLHLTFVGPQYRTCF